MRQLVERAGRLASAPRIPVSRQIDHVERRYASALHAIEVRQLRLAWCRAGAGDPLADERVDQARFADIRAPDQRQLGKAVVRQALDISGAANEGSGNLQRAGVAGWAGPAGWCRTFPPVLAALRVRPLRQWVIVSSLMASTGVAGSSAGSRPARGSASAIFRTSSIVWTMYTFSVSSTFFGMSARSFS